MTATSAVDRRGAVILLGADHLARVGARMGMLAAVLVIVALVLAPRRGMAQDVPRTTQLIGHVVDSAGVPIPGAEVMVMASPRRRALTDNAGFFMVDSVPVGAVQFTVRRLGYTPATYSADLEFRVVKRVTIRLATMVVALDTVNVVDSVQHPWLRTFEDRRATGRGIYFTRKDLVRSQVRTLSDILRRVPGAQLARMPSGAQRVVFNHGLVGGRPCPPQLFVHEMNYMGFVDDFTPDDVEAMEVYSTISSVPVELQTDRAHQCGAIVIWTREPPPAGARKPGGG